MNDVASAKSAQELQIGAHTYTLKYACTELSFSESYTGTSLARISGTVHPHARWK